MFCFFESGDGHFTPNGRKSLEKVFECFSAFQVVEEGLDGHAGSAKHRGSAKNIGIFDDKAHNGLYHVGGERAVEGQMATRSRFYGNEEKRDSSHPQADAFAGAKAEEKVGLLRSK